MRKVEVIDSGYVHEANQDGVFTYSGWPSVIRAEDGSLLVGYSGGRAWHLCPFGKEYIRRSYDEGKTWTNPIVAYDSPLDDRDAALVKLEGKNIALSFFTISREEMHNSYFQHQQGTPEYRLAMDYLSMLPENVDLRYAGRWISLSNDDGYTWSTPYPVEVFTPGGFKCLDDGSYIMVSQFSREDKLTHRQDRAVYTSADLKQWKLISRIPTCAEHPTYFHVEPEVQQLADGRLICMLRIENRDYTSPETHVFTLAISFSFDRGYTWTVPRLLDNDGAPGGLLRHSSGAVVCTYGSRKAPYGIKAMLSFNNGESWEKDYPLFTPHEDTVPAGCHDDNGYAKSIELDNGDVFTVFYNKEHNTRKCSIQYVRWKFAGEEGVAEESLRLWKCR